MSRADEWRKPENATLRKANAKNRNRVLAARRRKFLRENGFKNLQEFYEMTDENTYNEERDNWIRAVTQAEIDALNAPKQKKSKAKKSTAKQAAVADVVKALNSGDGGLDALAGIVASMPPASPQLLSFVPPDVN